MKTVFFSIDARQAACCAEEERRASGAPEGMRCVIIPRNRSAVRSNRGSILDFETCRRRLEQKQARDSALPLSCPSAPQFRRKRRRISLLLAADLCASAAVVAAAALALIHFCML